MHNLVCLCATLVPDVPCCTHVAPGGQQGTSANVRDDISWQHRCDNSLMPLVQTVPQGCVDEAMCETGRKRQLGAGSSAAWHWRQRHHACGSAHMLSHAVTQLRNVVSAGDADCEWSEAVVQCVCHCFPVNIHLHSQHATCQHPGCYRMSSLRCVNCTHCPFVSHFHILLLSCSQLGLYRCVRSRCRRCQSTVEAGG